MTASDIEKASIAEETDSTTPPMLQSKLKTTYPPLNNSSNAGAIVNHLTSSSSHQHLPRTVQDYPGRSWA